MPKDQDEKRLKPRKGSGGKGKPSLIEPQRAENPTRNYLAALDYFELEPVFFDDLNLEDAYESKMLSLSAAQSEDSSDRQSLEDEVKTANAAYNLIKMVKGWS